MFTLFLIWDSIVGFIGGTVLALSFSFLWATIRILIECAFYSTVNLNENTPMLIAVDRITHGDWSYNSIWLFPFVLGYFFALYGIIEKTLKRVSDEYREV